MDTYDRYIEIASLIARRIGPRIRGELSTGRYSVSHKGAVDLVTDIDRWSEREIKRDLEQHFPQHKMLGEESISESGLRRDEVDAFLASGTTWVVDPLDGTTNFVSGIPYCCISIAVVEEGEAVAGVVYDPFRDELFSAIRGRGALLNRNYIQVRKTAGLGESVIATGFPYDRREQWEGCYQYLFSSLVVSTRATRVLGAAALDQCWVGCGRLDGYVEYDLKPWDAAAGFLIARESGAEAFDFTKPDRTHTLTGDSFLLATPGISTTLCELAAQAYIDSLKNRR